MGSIHSERYRRFLGRLRAARVAAGLTQKDVAIAFERNQSWVSKCETGERRVDPIELAAFAELYRQPLDFFLEVPASPSSKRHSRRRR
ncbi:MAG: helix-turn-helix transcriptional regulator [Thermoanaerobaculia bacterium]|nr:helix-turn-helix transcriptional regulator [Thermoanaerobaculia bacterium]